jgi:hypothetical protein
MADPDEIEAGAQAIRQQVLTHAFTRADSLLGWHEIPEALRERYRREARACIEAVDQMRDLMG